MMYAPAYTITGHPQVKSGSTPNGIVCAIGSDVRTPGCVAFIDRTRLAEIIGALEPGTQVLLTRIPATDRTGCPLELVRVYRNF